MGAKYVICMSAVKHAWSDWVMTHPPSLVESASVETRFGDAGGGHDDRLGFALPETCAQPTRLKG